MIKLSNNELELAKKPVHTIPKEPQKKGPYLTGVIDTLLSSQRTHAHHHEPHSVQSDPGQPTHRTRSDSRCQPARPRVGFRSLVTFLWERFPRRRLRQAGASCSVRLFR